MMALILKESPYTCQALANVSINPLTVVPSAKLLTKIRVLWMVIISHKPELYKPRIYYSTSISQSQFSDRAKGHDTITSY